MHYYQFNISDFRSATAHLTVEEECCYRRLLDMYYDLEGPISLETESVSRRLRMETELVSRVLKEFFEEGSDGWHHARCDDEIGRYQARRTSARTNGSRGGRPRKTESVSERNPTETGSKPNQEPITKNHSTPQPPKRGARAVARPDDVPEGTWDDFLRLRKAKRAPLTETALAQIRRQAEQAKWPLAKALEESVTRGWSAFKAEWVAKRKTGKAATESAHIPNLPLGSPSCGCPECVKVRAAKKRSEGVPESAGGLVDEVMGGLRRVQ